MAFGGRGRSGGGGICTAEYLRQGEIEGRSLLYLPICLSYQYIKYNIQFKTQLPLSIKQLFNQANELTSQLAGKLTNVNRS